MAAASSPATDEAYGVRRVCAAWGMPRSSFYAARTVSEAPTPGRRRGPRPAVDDAGLLEAIRRDLDRSPFSGEGHRKVWARLRALDGLRVGRDRVLRLMRENALLSPHRGPQRPVNDHDGRITTDAPGVMWGTDAAVIPTVEDGNIALFVVVEHWNAEALGWHVAEKADRFAAAQALDLAIHTACGAVRADAARGLLLRHDHGSAFMSDHFQNQIAFLGMTPSFAFVREPETTSPRPTVWRSGSSAPSRSRSCGAGFSAMPRRFALRSGPSSRATTSTGCWRRMPTAALLRPGANGSPHSPQ
jgi:putative transposase